MMMAFVFSFHAPGVGHGWAKLYDYCMRTSRLHKRGHFDASACTIPFSRGVLTLLFPVPCTYRLSYTIYFHSGWIL